MKKVDKKNANKVQNLKTQKGEVRNSKQHEQQNLLDQRAQAEPSKEAKHFFKKVELCTFGLNYTRNPKALFGCWENSFYEKEEMGKREKWITGHPLSFCGTKQSVKRKE